MRLVGIIKDIFTDSINGYKKIIRLTDEETDKFNELHMEWKIFADSRNTDPLGLDSLSYETFDDIGKINKKKLDAYVDSLHKKYNTDSNTYGILKNWIVLRSERKCIS